MYSFNNSVNLLSPQNNSTQPLISKPLATKLSTPLSENVQLGLISHFLSPVSCDSLVLQGLRCEWEAGVLHLVLSFSLSHTGDWKFNMAPSWQRTLLGSGKIIIAIHKDGIGYMKISKTLKLSCSTVAKTIQHFNRTDSTQNRPRHGRPKKLSGRAQRHIQRFCLGNRRMSAASIAAEVEGVGVSLSVLRPYGAHCIKFVCMAVIPEGSLL